MRILLVPVFDDRVSSRLDCTEIFQLVKIEGNEIRSVEKLKIVSKNQIEKLNSIVSLKPDAVICNGLTKYFENEFNKNKIKVLPWIHGEFEDVVDNFISGNYNAG